MEIQNRVVHGQETGLHLLIIGGVHGDEFESMAAIRRLIRHLPTIECRGKVTFAPVVNEAAFRRGQRTAEDELDLARICPGRKEGTISEQTAHAVSEMIRAADYLIDLHSGGLVMRMGPVVGYTLHPDPEILNAERRMARAFNLPLVWGTTAALGGRTLSVARDAHIPAIYAEWLGAGECDPNGVNAYFEGCLNVMGALGMIDRSIPASIVQHVVEDDRDNSGHVQRNYPSPMDGFFEAAVEMGQRIEPGRLLGTVSDPLGDRIENIISTQSGIVLCLRVFNRVFAGDSLAAILETGKETDP